MYSTMKTNMKDREQEWSIPDKQNALKSILQRLLGGGGGGAQKKK